MPTELPCRRPLTGEHSGFHAACLLPVALWLINLGVVISMVWESPLMADSIGQAFLAAC